MFVRDFEVEIIRILFYKFYKTKFKISNIKKKSEIIIIYLSCMVVYLKTIESICVWANKSLEVKYWTKNKGNS